MCIFDVGIADTVPLLTERAPVQEWNKDCLLFMVEDYYIACLSLGFIEKNKRKGEQKFSIVTILRQCKRLVCFSRIENCHKTWQKSVFQATQKR